ncbi:hypothetical protein J6590_020346 [Homalodisca vitripennis]|nr:hypothetical protein J6590_020346 [Homalodisca vitripennis]
MCESGENPRSYLAREIRLGAWAPSAEMAKSIGLGSVIMFQHKTQSSLASEGNGSSDCASSSTRSGPTRTTVSDISWTRDVTTSTIEFQLLLSRILPRLSRVPLHYCLAAPTTTLGTFITVAAYCDVTTSKIEFQSLLSHMLPRLPWQDRVPVTTVSHPPTTISGTFVTVASHSDISISKIEFQVPVTTVSHAPTTTLGTFMKVAAYCDVTKSKIEFQFHILSRCSTTTLGTFITVAAYCDVNKQNEFSHYCLCPRLPWSSSTTVSCPDYLGTLCAAYCDVNKQNRVQSLLSHMLHYLGYNGCCTVSHHKLSSSHYCSAHDYLGTFITVAAYCDVTSKIEFQSYCLNAPTWSLCLNAPTTCTITVAAYVTSPRKIEFQSLLSPAPTTTLGTFITVAAYCDVTTSKIEFQSLLSHMLPRLPWSLLSPAPRLPWVPLYGCALTSQSNEFSHYVSAPATWVFYCCICDVTQANRVPVTTVSHAPTTTLGTFMTVAAYCDVTTSKIEFQSLLSHMLPRLPWGRPVTSPGRGRCPGPRGIIGSARMSPRNATNSGISPTPRTQLQSHCVHGTAGSQACAGRVSSVPTSCQMIRQN